MSLIKKADVENHRRERASGKILPFGSRSHPDATGYSTGGIRDGRGNGSGSEGRSDGKFPVLPAESTHSVKAVVSGEPLLKPSIVKASQA
jgi:hypothetical protein